MRIKKFFSIGETALKTGLTTETLRHYDRIGLVKPGKTDEWTGYRYYTQSEIIILNTVSALQKMDISLKEIKEILEYEDIGKIVAEFEGVLKKADKKIEELLNAKERIERAKRFYQSKMETEPVYQEKEYVKTIPERVILLSRNNELPTLDSLNDYHKAFYEQLCERGGEFSFEDAAGVFIGDTGNFMFAVCTEYGADENLYTLPGGKYLCTECGAEELIPAARAFLSRAKSYGTAAEYAVGMVKIIGILRWKYQLQVYIGGGE